MKRSAFIDDAAQDEDDEHGDNNDEDEDEEQGNVEGLIADRVEKDKHGTHLRASGIMRQAELDREQAELEAAEQRYQQLGSIYMADGVGGGGGGGGRVHVLDADSETGDMARAAAGSGSTACGGGSGQGGSRAQGAPKSRGRSPGKETAGAPCAVRAGDGRRGGDGSRDSPCRRRGEREVKLVDFGWIRQCNSSSLIVLSSAAGAPGRYRIKKKAKTN